VETKESAKSVGLTHGEIDTMLESLEYAKHWVREGQDATYSIRQQTLLRLSAVASKLRAARRGIKNGKLA
jgi:hypothetical protein